MFSMLQSSESERIPMSQIQWEIMLAIHARSLEPLRDYSSYPSTRCTQKYDWFPCTRGQLHPQIIPYWHRCASIPCTRLCAQAIQRVARFRSYHPCMFSRSFHSNGFLVWRFTTNDHLTPMKSVRNPVVHSSQHPLLDSSQFHSTVTSISFFFIMFKKY